MVFLSYTSRCFVNSGSTRSVVAAFSRSGSVDRRQLVWLDTATGESSSGNSARSATRPQSGVHVRSMPVIGAEIMDRNATSALSLRRVTSST